MKFHSGLVLVIVKMPILTVQNTDFLWICGYSECSIEMRSSNTKYMPQICLRVSYNNFSTHFSLL